jgi:NADPH-dependent 2,4-dienoyl-CoA reductase/sulfur reductase-like enzyme
MRVRVPGVDRSAAPFELSFEGRPVAAHPGESLAAALLNAGILGLRHTRTGEMRGLYCGMGVCGECRVMVDGAPRRACMVAAAPGQRVEAAPATMAAAAPSAPAPPAATRHVAPDLLVVGAGPAGLAAAGAAARAGLEVLIADERSLAGGQYFKQPGKGFAVDDARLDPQFREGRALADAAVAAGAALLPGATLWAALPGTSPDAAAELFFACSDALVVARPRRLILATGAYERPWPVPGWTLPGVMTTGAAQTLLRAYQTAPDGRILIAGNGPLNLQVAGELKRAGATVAALVEQAPAPGIGRAGAALRMAAASPALVASGARQLAALRQGGTPLLYGHVLVALAGDGCVEEAVVARTDADGAPVAGSERRFAVDAVCLGYGFLPQAEAARALGCRFVGVPGGGLAAERDDDGRTSVAGVFVVGDAGGLGGARVAIAQGTLAGTAVAAELGAAAAGAGSAAARRLLARHRAFQRALWELYAPAAGAAAPTTPETLLCRCESVTAAAVDALRATRDADLGGIKRGSRAGMGACQGRYCGALIGARLPAAPDADADGFAPRPPFKPVPIAAIAGADVERCANNCSLLER